MQSELPYWENISIFAQDDKCDSYRYPTHLKILEDGLGCIKKLWKYQYILYVLYFTSILHSHGDRYWNTLFIGNRDDIKNTGISTAL